MFKASVSDAKLWRDTLTAISALIEEADFNATPDGVKLRAMDASHVAMVDFEWQKKAFDVYECPEPTKIRFSITSMLKLLKRVASDEVMEMVYDDNTKKINMTLKGKMVRKFTIPTLDPSQEEVPTPKLTFNTKVKLTTSILKDIIDDVQAVSDNVWLEATREKFTATATELNSAVIELSKGSEVLLGLDVTENSKAAYNLNFMAQIVKAGASVSEIAVIEFSSNMPIRIAFDMPEKGLLQYYLAPRLEAQEGRTEAK